MLNLSTALNDESPDGRTRRHNLRMKMTKVQHKEDVGRRIQTAREALNLTPKAFGTPVGLTSPALWNIETGRAYPSIYALCCIAEEYGLTTDYLLLGHRGGLPRDLADRIRAVSEDAD